MSLDPAQSLSSSVGLDPADSTSTDWLAGSVQDTEAYDKKVLGFKGDIFAVKEESEEKPGTVFFSSIWPGEVSCWTLSTFDDIHDRTANIIKDH